jgi:two-component system C4-dicarboxylate transport response regulator DctD
VRELRNVADRFVLGLLDERLTLTPGGGEMPSVLPEQIEHFERAVITDALRRCGGDVPATAKALGLPKQTLYDKLKRLKLSAEGFRGDA